MQAVKASKTLEFALAGALAVVALVAALFAVQPAYAAEANDLAAGDAAVSVAVKAPTTKAVMIDRTTKFNFENTVAGQTGEWTVEQDAASKKLATATIKADSKNPLKATLSVKGKADGNATIKVTFTNDNGLSNTADFKVKVTGVKKSSKVTASGIVYKRVSKTTVKVVTVAKSKKAAKTIAIPNTVKIANKSGFKATYKVTAIAPQALHKLKKVTKITVGDNVKTIGKHAFCADPKLKTLVLGKNVTKLAPTIVHVKNNSLKTITIKSAKLTKKNVKNCFKGNKYLKTVKLSGKAAKAKKAAYKKIFTKANAGKKVTVK